MNLAYPADRLALGQKAIQNVLDRAWALHVLRIGEPTGRNRHLQQGTKPCAFSANAYHTNVDFHGPYLWPNRHARVALSGGNT